MRVVGWYNLLSSDWAENQRINLIIDLELVEICVQYPLGSASLKMPKVAGI